ncbi:hypothetical protein A3L04_09220 [Thermococcus chitonophagus]|uniref:Uncharacterized protein n=1 Tax=Thermococcus chitonophagus TaxID=54262 RepID=A0A160VVM5_9EURY|nr:hypothetical protein [Thermococcus chitonophagus]ASJ17234.1 hypothetical protein A3L04_09220 [Thermococcus chitonophagus]CUX77851.1 hypothetical protein CHITON_1072 [Thermococcus chitonophagus]
MGTAARIAIAILLIGALIFVPIATVQVGLRNYQLTYSEVAILAFTKTIGSIIHEVTAKDVIPEMFSEVKNREEVDLVMFFFILLMTLLLAAPIGSLVALASRAGFGLVIISMLPVTVYVFNYGTPQAGLYIVWGLALLGLAFGGSKKSKG